MYNYNDEPTNDVSNPFNHHRSFYKQKYIDESPPRSYNEDYSNTIANPHLLKNTEQQTIRPGKLPKKIQASTLQSKNQASHKKSIFDDTLTKTKKVQHKKIIKTQPPQQTLLFSNDPLSKILTKNLKIALQQKIIIPEPSPQAESILSGPKLREKYGNLLPKAHQKPLSFEQHHLLKIFSMMDETIEFSNNNRSNKFVFFEDLKRTIRDSLKVFVEIKHLEQLLYLDETLFEVKWEWSCTKKGYDVMITLPKIKSKDQRKTKVRQILVDYLNQKHKQFLISKGLQPNQNDGPWHPDFQPGRYQIPRKTIPVHPQTRDAELRCFDQNKIEKIQNTNLKQLIQNKKQQSEVHSFKSKSVMDMIFAGVGSKNIESQILKAVREKEENVKKNKILQEQRIEKQKTEIEPDILKQISQTILFLYMSKSVSNMFKVKLIELVKQKTNHKFGSFIVDRHIEHLIELKDIGYLKELVTGKNKPVMIQINKAKAKEITTYAETLRQRLKQRQRTDLNNCANAEMII